MSSKVSFSFLVLAILFFLSKSLYAQEKDSITIYKNELKNQKDPLEQANQLFKIGSYYFFKTDEYDSSKKYLILSSKIYKKLNEVKKEADSYVKIATIYRKRHDNFHFIEYNSLAEKTYVNLKDTMGLIKALTQRTWMLPAIEAIKTNHRVIDLAEKIGRPKLTTHNINNLGDAYYRLEKKTVLNYTLYNALIRQKNSSSLGFRQLLSSIWAPCIKIRKNTS